MYKLSTIFTKTMLFILLLCCSILDVFGQSTAPISGRVVDAKNIPIIGATILEANTTNGVITDVNGEFKFNVNNLNATLQIIYVGMKQQDIPLKGRNVLDVILVDDNLVISDVIVTALGIKRETKALGYAVASVGADVLSAGKEQNVMSAIAGKVAGVDISTTAGGPSGSTRVLIRGNSQLSGSNLPLYVIDGMPVDNTQFDSADEYGGYDYGDVLSSINPDDIESISILKGPSASALYGSQASNGVVLITTKSAGEKNGIGVQFSSNVSVVSLLTSLDDYQRVYGQGTRGEMPTDLDTSQRTTQKSWGARLDPTQQSMIFNGELKPYANVNDNLFSFFRTGVTYNNSIAFTNKMDKGSFRLSISDLRNDDIIPGSEMNRTTFMFKGDTKLSKNITISAQANYSLEEVINRPALSNSNNNIGNSIIGIAPSFDQAWLANGYKNAFGEYVDWNRSEYRINPYWVINEMENQSNRARFTGRMAFKWSLMKGLSLTGNAGTDRYIFKISDYASQYTPRRVDGDLISTINDVYKNNFEAMLRYETRISDFGISGFVGANLSQSSAEVTKITGKGEVMPGIRDITNYAIKVVGHSISEKEVRSLFASASIDYKNFIYLDATLRNDISSTLSPENRSYIYPSVSGSFVFTELFEQNSPILSFGKLRASWAKVGGDTDPYQLSLQYGLKDYTVSGIPLGEISSTTAPNYDIKPTSTYSYEFGVDLKFFGSRLGVDATYYNQRTEDQIMRLSVSSATGYNYVWINAGQLTNKGVELSISGVPIQTRNFNWDINVNVARNINSVDYLHEDVKNYELAAARWTDTFIYAQEGEAYGVIIGKKIARTEAGEIIYKNGLLTYEDNVSVLGNGTSDVTMGINNAFRYKNFTLSALLDMKFGAEVFSMSNMTAHENGTSTNTLVGRQEWYASEVAREANGKSEADWIATGGFLGEGVMSDGAGGYVSNDVYVDPEDYWNSITSAEPFIYDASYIKLKELSVAYSFTSKSLKKTPFRTISISAYARNIFTIYSNIPNIDAESSYSNGNGQGLELGSLPARRTFGFGINLTF